MEGLESISVLWWITIGDHLIGIFYSLYIIIELYVCDKFGVASPSIKNTHLKDHCLWILVLMLCTLGLGLSLGVMLFIVWYDTTDHCKKCRIRGYFIPSRKNKEKALLRTLSE